MASTGIFSYIRMFSCPKSHNGKCIKERTLTTSCKISCDHSNPYFGLKTAAHYTELKKTLLAYTTGVLCCYNI